MSRLGYDIVKAFINSAARDEKFCAMKLGPGLGVLAGNTMVNFINTFLMLGGLVAAGVVAVLCAVCLVVWVAGGKRVARK